MKDGFIKVAAGIPEVTVADTSANTQAIKNIIVKADENKVNLLVLPELCITGYTCGDLFFNETLTNNAKASLFELADFSKDKYPIIIVGLPLVYSSKLFNCAAVLHQGEVLGIIPKTFLPNHAEFNEKRYFESASVLGNDIFELYTNEKSIDFGTDIIFRHEGMKNFSFGVEICEDLFAPTPVNQRLASGGANIIVNPAACNQTIGKTEYCKNLISSTSARLNCGYVLASSGKGESTMDTVFAGFSAIAENGKIIAENKPFSKNDIIISEIDVNSLSNERYKNTSFTLPTEEICINYFYQEICDTVITRHIERNPFLPESIDSAQRAEEILQIQSHGLARRLAHTHAKTAVIGISGGLDSTLALLVSARAMKLLGRPMTDIIAITMPCFGTTKRTRSNSEILCNELGVTFKEVNITAAVKQHFADIGQSETNFDVTYENSQARERTQVLMDIANKENGLVIGTGDLSELALGWATYNGDHMSMYGVNCDVPKTLIKHVVKHEAENSEKELKKVLLDILDTPVSPELLPADSKGEIAQKTEDLVGPYELHDFFLYHTVRYNEGPAKIFRLACIAFPDYEKSTIKHWLATFTRRFFNQQFKRSCLPDGPKVGSVALSPRGDWKMPTDASSTLWLKEIEKIEV